MLPKRRREGSDGSGSSVGGGRAEAGSGGGGGGGGRGGGRPTQPHPPLPRAPPLKRRCRWLDLEIRGCSHIQELITRVEAIEAAISRIPEELKKVFVNYFNNIPGARIEKSLPPTYKLVFVNSMRDHIFTKTDLQAVDGGQIKIKMVVSNQQDSNCPRLLSSNVKIVVLDGDFNADNREVWTSDEFDDHIVRPRDKVGAVLTGKLDIKLKDGEACLHGITFIDNSSFTRSRKFRLGVKLLDDIGERVQEGVTELFTVKDRRGEGYRKQEIPRLDDEVWRLKGIAKGGVFHAALEASGISSVGQLLRLYYKDAKTLRNIIGNASQTVWTAIIDHAKKCDPGSSLYSHFTEGENIRLYVSSLGQIVGATIAGQYNAYGDLDPLRKAQVEELSKDAYKRITYHHHDYEMYNGQPRPINYNILQESIIPWHKPTEPDDQTIHEEDEKGTSKGNQFSGTLSQCTFERLGSMRVRTLSPLQENNETVGDQIRRFINPMFSKLEKLETKLERMKERIQDRTIKVDNITRPSPNIHNDEQFMQEENQEGTSAEPQGLSTAQGKGENTNIRLRFLNKVKTRVYHDDEIKSESNTAIKIGIFNGDRMIESGGLSNVQVEIFALDGDFPHASPKSWTAKKFNKHRANSRDGNGNVLAGEGTKVKLKNGQCDLGSIKFTEGSCKARGAKFIIGARICEGEVSGLRVQEAVMNPVAVRDRRNKANEKNHPPKLNDSVQRLEEIAKVSAERLKKEKILTVEDFLKALNKDPYNLAKILIVNMEHKPRMRMTEHARECSLEGRHKLKLFICTEKNVKLFFNCVHYLVGAEFFGGPYTLSENFTSAQQELVGQLKKDAHMPSELPNSPKLDALPEDYVMTDNSPSPIHVDKYTSIFAGSSYMPSEQPNCYVPLASVQGMAAAEGLSYSQIESSCGNGCNNLIPSSIPEHPRMHKLSRCLLQSCNCFFFCIVIHLRIIKTHYSGRSKDPYAKKSTLSTESFEFFGGDIPVPLVEDLNHAQDVFANEINNELGPSSSNSHHLYPYNYQDQWNQHADQEQFSAFANTSYQNALGGTSNMGQFVPHEDVHLSFRHEQEDTQLRCATRSRWCGYPESALLARVNGTLDASASAHINIALPPQQPLYAGTPRSPQESTQSQMQAPLAPSNDASVESASAQQALPLQQWYPGDNSW